MNKQNKREIKKHQVIVKRDSLYRSYWVEKFINKFMKGGNKQRIEEIVFQAFKKIKSEIGRNPFYLLINLLIRFKPLFGFILTRKGKEWKKVPVPLDARRQIIISLNWLTTSIRVSRFMFFKLRLVHEFLELNARKKNSFS